MQEYQERVVKEKAELDEKIAKLTAFIMSGMYKNTTQEEQDRLYRQLGIMREYSAVLNERISAFR